jgi:hypothetical protein
MKPQMALAIGFNAGMAYMSLITANFVLAAAATIGCVFLIYIDRTSRPKQKRPPAGEADGRG